LFAINTSICANRLSNWSSRVLGDDNFDDGDDDDDDDDGKEDGAGENDGEGEKSCRELDDAVVGAAPSLTLPSFSLSPAFGQRA
tara:strand:- start:4 stop:255 length:252 start_codon:yes stop_codon:yes gene_type:complete